MKITAVDRMSVDENIFTYFEFKMDMIDFKKVIQFRMRIKG
jgi:hypothetical protein